MIPFTNQLCNDSFKECKLLKNFKTMQIDLVRDLKKAADARRIQVITGDSPFDTIMEEGIMPGKE